MDENLYQYFSCLLNATNSKRSNVARASELYKEYDELEHVPPAPGCPGEQHDAMVENGNLFHLKLHKMLALQNL